MKHATERTLSSMSWMLAQLRALPGLTERKTGIFYRKSRAFLHFHEDGAELFVDVRLQEPEFARFPVTTRAQQKHVLVEIRRSL